MQGEEGIIEGNWDQYNGCRDGACRISFSRLL